MLTLNVLYFALVRERAGTAREAISLAVGATVRDAIAAIVVRHPALGELVPAVRVALDGEFVGLDAPLRDGAELVLIPPVSGGADDAGHAPFDAVLLTDKPLDDAHLARVRAFVSGPGLGGIALFLGAVRDHARGRTVTRLEYEAYPSMAERQMRAIVAAVEADHAGTRCALHHRVGALDVGEVAVIAAAASAHRAAAFDAVRELIERLKADVPIWKREIGPDGAVWISERP